MSSLEKTKNSEFGVCSSHICIYIYNFQRSDILFIYFMSWIVEKSPSKIHLQNTQLYMNCAMISSKSHLCYLLFKLSRFLRLSTLIFHHREGNVWGLNSLFA